MPLISANSKTPALYVLAGAGSVAMSNLANAQTLTGMTFNCLEVFNTNVPTWADWEAPWFANDPSQGYTTWVAADPSNRQLIVSYNLISQQGGSMADPLTWETAGAGGAFNSHATALAANLVANGLGSSIIRMGLECNGNWNIDSIGGSTPGGGTVQMRNLWAQTFQQEITAMRAVAGANFLFCWCPNAVVAGVPFADYYPGNAYVDIIGIDAYDAFANGSQPAKSAAAFNQLAAQSFGLNDITSFAVAQGKPLALGEYGTQHAADGGLDDDEFYIQGIANWVHNNQVAFHSYFDSDNDGIIPLSASFPLTLNAYKAAFAGVAGTAPAVTTGAATGVTSSAATLNGTVNPNGLAATYQFEYGTTTGYGTVTPASPGSAGSGSVSVNESASLSGLSASTAYHYRLNATNGAGTTNGPDQVFTTAGGGGGGSATFTVSASVDNFNDGGALKVFAVTSALEAGGASGQLQAFDPGAATVSLTPAASGSLVLWGIFTRATATLTAAASNSVSNTAAIGSSYEYADGRYTGTVTGGSALTAGCSTAVANWNDIVAYELKQSGTPAIDVSSPAAVTSTTSPMTTASFTPPAGSVLAAVIMSSAAGTLASTITMSDSSGLGLTWTKRVQVDQTHGFSYAGVAAIYTATVPASAPSNSGSPSTGIRITPAAAGTPGSTSFSGNPATGIHIAPSAAGAAGGTSATATGITFTPSASGLRGGAGPFPATTLGVKVELLLGGAWTDITATYVRTRTTLNITGAGRPDWTSSLGAAQLTLTLDNRDGRFTPKNTAGAYYPNITRNTQIRVSVSAQSATGVLYSGYRFWGEVSAWPPTWDVSGRDVWCDITASGIWRRMSQLQTTLGSAYRRYTTALAGIRSYWPMEDGAGSGQLVPYGSVAGTANAVQSFVTGQAGLSLAACTDFKGSDGIPQLNAAAVTCTVPAGGTATNNVTRFAMSVPAAGDSASGTTNWNLAEVAAAGTVAKFEVYLNFAGTLLMQLRNSGGTVIASGTTTTNVKGHPYLVSCELTPSGGNVAFALRIIAPGGTGITESLTGTVSSASVGAVSTVKFGRANVLMDTAAGHCSVSYSAPSSMVSAAYALGGYLGEKAADRFTRICAEMGIASELIGTAATSAAMGPQVDDTLSNVLQSVEDTDMGLLFESRNQFGIGYRTLGSLANQAAAAVIAYSGGPGLDPSLSPVYDDSLTRNNVTVTNWTGYTQQAILTVGPMSILNPPAGIGNGYAYPRTVNAASDTQVAGIANWLLGVGSVDEIRFPVVTVKLARAQAAPLFAALPGLRPGDYIQVTGMPAWMPSGTVKQLAWGYSETLGPKEWTLAFNTVPESPYETGFSPGTVQLAQLPGGSPVTSQAPGAGGLGGVIANGSITPAMLSEGITVKNLGGTRTTISVSAPANPDMNDIWIASATGLISTWNGSSWTPITFNGASTLQAGSVVASNIATSTLTASLFAAGIAIIGIVDATTVKAAEYDAFSTGGQFLAYDTSSPGSGHLINSIAGASGTDSASNPYPKGFYGQGLTLASQSSAPPSFAGSSVLYTSSSGRLRYLSSTGNDLVLDRSVLDLTNIVMTTSGTPTRMSSILNYIANEAQVGSEYEIEIDGTITTPSATPQIFDIQLFLDGATMGGGQIQLGAVMLQAGQTFAYTMRWRATIEALGSGGTCTVACDGGIARLNVPLGNTQAGGGLTTTSINRADINRPFDTTGNHTLAIYMNWDTAPGSGGATTLRTKKTRRN